MGSPDLRGLFTSIDGQTPYKGRHVPTRPCIFSKHVLQLMENVVGLDGRVLLVATWVGIVECPIVITRSVFQVLLDQLLLNPLVLPPLLHLSRLFPLIPTMALILTRVLLVTLIPSM